MFGELVDDRRGQSIGISRFFLALVVGAVVIWIVNLITSPILNRASNATSNASANQATVWLSDWFNWTPIFFLLVSFIGVIVFAVYRREIIGR